MSETRARIAVGEGTVAELRSGADVPVVLPDGFTIYPAARVVRNTVVVSAGARRVLVEFETPDPVLRVVLFHRAQAQAAGVSLSIDLDGPDAASIGGRTAASGDFSLTVRRDGQLTHAQLAIEAPR